MGELFFTTFTINKEKKQILLFFAVLVGVCSLRISIFGFSSAYIGADRCNYKTGGEISETTTASYFSRR